jgi:large subunit ribosomal protein L4
MQTTVYSSEGKAGANITLPAEVFGVAWHPDLVHQVVTGMQANARAGTAHTKDRSEVRGGGAKPWRQKGTGRARHGSRRSPIWVGGGVTFGPRSEKDYSVKLNKKARQKAFASTLSKKLYDNEVFFVESLHFAEPKAKDAKAVIENLAKGLETPGIATKKQNAVLVVLPARNLMTEKSFRNFGNIEVAMAKDISPVDLLTYKYVVFVEPTPTVEILAARAGTATDSNTN